MRTVTLVLVDGSGSVLGSLPAFDVDLPWWAEVADVVAGARDRFGAEVTVLRLLHAERPQQPGGAVTYLASVHGPVPGLAPADVDLHPHPRRAPYAEVGGPEASLRWAAAELRYLGLGAPVRTVQRKTWNLSALWQLDGVSRRYWLKHLPPFLKAESEVLAWLGVVAPGAAPRLLAADGTGRQLLGDLPGEDRFGAPAAERFAMADLLHGVQRWALDEPPRGVLDRRGTLLYRQIMVAAEPWLSEIFGLDELLSGLPERLAAVADCGVPDTLVHGDFHPGNVRAAPGVPLAVLDWGDAFLGHPGFDILRLTQGLPPSDEAALIEHWAAQWRRVAPGSDPIRVAALLRPVAALLGAVVYANFIHNIEPSEWPYHALDVPDCLRTAVTQA
ncbi:aminoglycoside phosphotransferase family protein [Dactylosporangium sp. AC04546]|uniref:aminoglycoside phosphotransferase family protein n=1 Tax=Dactylosporangium sp. AC04546 TaxID=2862460 RepID=UPI001EDE5CBE|nr:aminoglycoside phosphotransferase family protein [Dactylosporangium sp. AC04546]WVK83512.1 aminoglycoside phosphotransferase family protein [Dactylosporangium sp. AC04546]